MPRKLGIEYPGAIYHGMSRGNRRDAIFLDDVDRLGWRDEDLAKRHKSHPGKLALAAKLRRETTLPLKWIAARLRMGTWKSAGTRLQTWKKAHQRKRDAR
jgi:hypothetical protein